MKSLNFERNKTKLWCRSSLRNAQKVEQKQVGCWSRDKCTIRSASSQAACTSCLIPESDTLTLAPPPPSLSLLLLLSNEELHITTSKPPVKMCLSGTHPHTHLCSVQTSTCDRVHTLISSAVLVLSPCPPFIHRFEL